LLYYLYKSDEIVNLFSFPLLQYPTLTCPPHCTPSEVRFSSKYAERVAAKHPVTLDRRFIHPRPERKEG
jgi:hypothetical protein